MLRGEIWWAIIILPAPTASEPGYRRPLLIIQSDDFNRSRINTVIAVVLTSNLRLSQGPGNVTLSKKDTNLPRRSVVNVSQLITVDKSFLIEKVAKWTPQKIKEVEAGIRLALSL